MESLLDPKRVTNNEENFFVLRKMITQLDKKAIILWTNIFYNLESNFEDIKRIREDLKKQDKDKIS